MSETETSGKSGIKVLADNRKARFNYTVEDTLECGIELQGTEVKSIRGGKFSFTDSYARVMNGELILFGFHIAAYKFGNIHNHDPLRERRLLAHKQEIKRLQRRVDERGYTLVPLKVYLKAGMVKVLIGICKGKQTHDKRNSIKDRDLKRDAQREMRDRMR
ncbi:MAG: SsrA-binding protein SmpB [Spirochaetia bacterium]|nr:SsrA-binding protein SmpB [Spirochaetia bacterium]